MEETVFFFLLWKLETSLLRISGPVFVQISRWILGNWPADLWCFVYKMRIGSFQTCHTLSRRVDRCVDTSWQMQSGHSEFIVSWQCVHWSDPVLWRLRQRWFSQSVFIEPRWVVLFNPVRLNQQKCLWIWQNWMDVYLNPAAHISRTEVEGVRSAELKVLLTRDWICLGASWASFEVTVSSYLTAAFFRRNTINGIFGTVLQGLK